MKDAIKKAIEGGYITLDVFSEDPKTSFLYERSLLLDLLFWQTLGKSLGWNSKIGDSRIGGSPSYEWKHEWHRFIDHLASGKDADSFFKGLLK